MTCYSLVHPNLAAVSALYTTLKWLVFPHPLHILLRQGTVFGDVLFYSAYNFLPASAFYVWHGCVFVYFVWLSQSPWPLLCCLMLPFALSGSLNLWAHNSTHSLLASLMSSCTDTSLSISLIMPSSSSLCMSCSFSFLLYWLQSQSAAFFCKLSIHSRADSWLFHFSLRYYSNSTIL